MARSVVPEDHQETLRDVTERIQQITSDLGSAREQMACTREYLLQAAYAHERGWPCPRCGKPMESYEDGVHACLAIERLNETELMREQISLETELAELRTVEIELSAGVVYLGRSLPDILTPFIGRSRTDAELQQRRLVAKQALRSMG